MLCIYVILIFIHYRIRQLSLSVQSVAVNLAGIGKNEHGGQEKQSGAQEQHISEHVDLGGLLSSVSCEFLSLLVLRLFLLVDRPLLAILFCEAMGCWHVALLIAKISRIIITSFEEYPPPPLFFLLHFIKITIC
jgi:hypothetical protein